MEGKLVPRTGCVIWLRRGVSVIAVTGLLCGCAPGAMTTREQRIGPDDGTDACRPQLVALDSTGNFFGAQILQGAATGAAVGALAGGLIGGLATGGWRGAAIGALAGGVTGGVVGGTNAYWSALQQQQMDQAALYSHVSYDLQRENEAIDKTQLAFDQLEDCRFQQASAINADYAAHRIDRATAEAAMALVRQHAAKDIALAKLINQQIQDRGQQFGVASSNVDPGAAAAISAASQTETQIAVVRSVTPVMLQPTSGAPQITQLQPREQVTVSSGRNGYALVQTSSGQQGYVSAISLQGSGGRSISVPTTQPTAAPGDVRTLAGSNAARRDDFAQSVSVMEKAQATGFELTG
jgi:outer membrane lipoprotein SlyB